MSQTNIIKPIIAINAIVSMNENELISSLNGIKSKFEIQKMDNSCVLQVCVRFKDDIHFNRPFLSIYCVIEWDKSLITDIPFAFLQICMVFNNNGDITIGTTKTFDNSIFEKSTTIYCLDDDNIQYLKNYQQYFFEKYGLRTNLELIKGEIFDSDVVQTF